MSTVTVSRQCQEVNSSPNDLSSIAVFNHAQFGQVRVIERDSEPWFVNPDVCRACGISDTRQAVESLDDDERYIVPVTDSLGREQETYIISEAGLYSLILRSRKPEAKAFKRWVTHEVIPSIRKHGGYLTPAKIEEALSDPDTIIRLATDLKEERRRRAALESRAALDRPKVIFADAVDASTTSILVGDLAKLLRQNSVGMGQKRLFAWLRDNGYLMKVGESRNMPTQYAMELGLFEIKERTVNNPDGSIRITRTPKVTGKGQIYFIGRFKASCPREATA